MTLDMFLEHLRAASAAQPVRFETDFGDVQPGYHVTELKLHRITGVDCGGLLEFDHDHVGEGVRDPFFEEDLHHEVGIADHHSCEGDLG